MDTIEPGRCCGLRGSFALVLNQPHVPLQGHHRQQPSCPDPVCPEDRDQGRLFGAEPDGQPQHANVAAELLKVLRAGALHPPPK